MGSRPRNRLLEQLDAAKLRVGEIDPARLNKLLQSLGRQNFPDAQSLARFHDGLVFLRAFPPNRTVLRRVESLLTSFSQRIGHLLAQGIDLSMLDEEELAGIAGTTLSGVWNYDEVAWTVSPRRSRSTGRATTKPSAWRRHCPASYRCSRRMPGQRPMGRTADGCRRAGAQHRDSGGSSATVNAFRARGKSVRQPSARWNGLAAANWDTHQ